MPDYATQPEVKSPILIVKPHRLDAYEFGLYSDPSFSFGMNKEKAAQVLRETADRIESGEYVLQSGAILTQAAFEDYAMTILTLEFHAKKVAE
jgi:hypothetical protein